MVAACQLNEPDLADLAKWCQNPKAAEGGTAGAAGYPTTVATSRFATCSSGRTDFSEEYNLGNRSGTCAEAAAAAVDSNSCENGGDCIDMPVGDGDTNPTHQCRCSNDNDIDIICPGFSSIEGVEARPTTINPDVLGSFKWDAGFKTPNKANIKYDQKFYMDNVEGNRCEESNNCSKDMLYPFTPNELIICPDTTKELIWRRNNIGSLYADLPQTEDILRDCRPGEVTQPYNNASCNLSYERFTNERIQRYMEEMNRQYKSWNNKIIDNFGYTNADNVRANAPSGDEKTELIELYNRLGSCGCPDGEKNCDVEECTNLSPETTCEREDNNCKWTPRIDVFGPSPYFWPEMWKIWWNDLYNLNDMRGKCNNLLNSTIPTLRGGEVREGVHYEGSCKTASNCFTCGEARIGDYDSCDPTDHYYTKLGFVHEFCEDNLSKDLTWQQKEECFLPSRQLKVGYDLDPTNSDYEDNTWVEDGLAANQHICEHVIDVGGWFTEDFHRSRQCVNNCEGCYAYYDGTQHHIRDQETGSVAYGYYSCKDYPPDDSRRVCEIGPPCHKVETTGS